MERALAKQYIATLAQLAAHAGTFRSDAAALLRVELADPAVNVNELLDQIHEQPSTPFEKYLRLAVRHGTTAV